MSRKPSTLRRQQSEVTKSDPVHHAVPLGLGWWLEVEARPPHTTLRIRQPTGGRELEIHIALTPEGPVVRTTAVSVEIDAVKDVVTRCESFRVEAAQSIDLVSKGAFHASATQSARIVAGDVSIEAERHDVRLHANDDVKLQGEMILLNCDRPEAPPAWCGAESAPPTSLPAANVSGDVALAEWLAKQGPSGPDQ